jgi:hypothetical protein
MRSDTKALLKVFGWSLVIAVAVMGCLAALAFVDLSEEVKKTVIGYVAVFFVVAAIILGGVYRSALMRRERKNGTNADSSA